MTSVFSQIRDNSSENYKIALRMKLRIESNPRLYMNEPKSALLNNIFDNCNDYILLDERGYDKVLNRKMVQITNDVKSFSETNYYQPVKKKKPSNIHYHYFSLKSEID
tara:strand:- start:207 stop:530 length:324 start_codon:yes stop_codon:yes gene_type:complete